MDEEGTTLATEIFQELKTSAKRWFIAFLIMLFIELGTVGGFLWYINLPADETAVTQEMDDINNSDAMQRIGDDFNGTDETNSDTQAESN